MAQFNRKTTFPDQLWNVSLLPMPAPRRAHDLPPNPPAGGGGSALRSAAVLSLSEHENPQRTAQAA